MLARCLFAAVLLLSGSAPALGQGKLLTLEDLFHPDKKKNFSGSPPVSRAWVDDEHYLESVPEKSVTLIEARSGDRKPVMDRDALREAFAALPGFSKSEADEAAEQPVAAESSDGSALLFNFKRDLFLFQNGKVRRLTHTPSQDEREEDFSPDGRMVSFVRGNDIHVADLEAGSERRLTSGGGPETLNGVLDWVYQEEVYGRGNFRAYWWSPDSSTIAYLQLDESKVPRFYVIDHRPVHLENEVMRYPKAGDPNPGVRLGAVSAAGGETHWLDLSEYEGREILIVRVGWTPDGAKVVYQVQDREQTWLHVAVSPPFEDSPQTIIKEESPAWVNVLGEPHWLDDGSFLWLSERNGWSHVYHYDSDFKLKGAVTEGQWDVRDLHCADPQGWVYFEGTERSYIAQDIYRIRLDGSALTRLSDKGGTHSAAFNPACTLYLDTWSDFDTPPQVRLYKSTGELARVIDENIVKALREYDLPKAEFLNVKTRDGFVMEALMIKPPDFDSSRKYPVMSYTYSGPQAPQVRNRWGRSRMLWHRFLAQQGYLVWVCDNRSASAKGVQSAWPIHRNLGELELRDLEEGLEWLASQPYVDASRIGLWGWSYGGYMTSYAVTNSDSFKIGIAGAPVTSWRLYDTIYTERYMGRPQTNPEGYRRSAPLEHAENLSAKLLIIHGTIDDNVHMQNSIQFADRLQKADKPFELMLYPGSRHGVRMGHQVWHLYQLMTRFIRENL